MSTYIYIYIYTCICIHTHLHMYERMSARGSLSAQTPAALGPPAAPTGTPRRVVEVE